MDRLSVTIIGALNNAPASMLHICDIKQLVSLPKDSTFSAGDVEDLVESLLEQGIVERSGAWIRLIQ